MKKLSQIKTAILLGLLTMNFMFSIAQTPLITWKNCYGGSWNRFTQGGDYANSIQATNDGGFIIAGNTRSNDGDVTGNKGMLDIWIVKLGYYGNIEWQKTIGGSNDDYARSIQHTNDGGYIVAGASRSNNGDVYGNHGGLDFWVIKLNSSGNITWQNSIGGSGNEIANSIQQTSDGGYIVAGYSNSNDGDVSGNQGSNDFWVVKLNSVGSITWQKSYGGSGNDKAESVIENIYGGYAIIGSSSSIDGDVYGNHGLSDVWGLTLYSNGDIYTSNSLGGSDWDKAYSIKTTVDGGYIIAGTSNSMDGDVSGNNGSYDFWIIKVGYYLELQWQKSYGGLNLDIGYSVEPTTDGDYVVAGYSGSNDGDVYGNHGGVDFWVIKLNSLGNIIWQKAMGGSINDYAYSITENVYGGYTVAGTSNSSDGDVHCNHSFDNFWVVNLHESGAREKRSGSNSSPINLSVFPNPTNNDGFNINLTGLVNESNQISIDVYDPFGRTVYTERSTEGKGDYSTQINAGHSFASGIYLVNVSANGNTFQEKVLVK